VKVRFLPAAEEELNAAMAYYQAINPLLRKAFRSEATEIRNQIAQHPTAWHPVQPPYRQCRFRRFPYAFIYEPRKSEIVVVAVAHLRRKPGYWHERINP
jgi:toxin ParE2